MYRSLAGPDCCRNADHIHHPRYDGHPAAAPPPAQAGPRNRHARPAFRRAPGIGRGHWRWDQLEWDHLGEETDLRSRGRMLDEGLDILVGLWSGEPFQYDGEHYHIEQAQFLPKPLQQPRIPVWVGGEWPNKRPFRRMARWDGMFPLFDVYGPEQEPVFAEAVAFVQAERKRLGLEGPFDVIKMGMTPGDDATEAAARVNSAAEAGATWWLELLMPEVYGLNPTDPQAYAVLRNRVMQGPPAAG